MRFDANRRGEPDAVRSSSIWSYMLLVSFALILAGAIGIGTGVWVSQYGVSRSAEVVRFVSDVLAGVPSIVIGYFGYVLFVERLGWHFSLAAGAIALMLVMLPYVVRGADQALSAVPNDIVEASMALGATRAQMLLRVGLPYAAPNILTAVLLATGIALGETAPLIYTAGWSNYMPSLALTHSPVGYLTCVVWTFISQPFAQSHALAYAAAALLMMLIFLTNVVARLALAEYARVSRGS